MAAGAGGGEAGVEESAATEIVAASGDEHMGGEADREERPSEWRTAIARFPANIKAMATLRRPLRTTSGE